jgi:hypothetical protein
VTFLTPPEPTDVLRRFYARVRPGGPGWRAVVPGAVEDTSIGNGLVQWVLGCVVVYLGLFGIGDVVFGRWLRGALALAVALVLTVTLLGRVRAGDRVEGGVVS